MTDRQTRQTVTNGIREYMLFQPTDKPLLGQMVKSEILIWLLNKTPLWFLGVRNWLFKKIVAEIDGMPYAVYSPIHLQQGNNTHIGKDFFCNYNCLFLDHAGIWIGNSVFLAPNVSIITVSHPMVAEERIVRKMENTYELQGRGNIELDRPVRIGNNVWIATGAIICPGVTIGDNAVIGAGSVVTKDIPPNVFACGCPAKVVREITEEDRYQSWL